MSNYGLLLAAGQSSRMGTDSPKPLLDWFGEPLVSAQARSLLNSGLSRVVVVTGALHNEIQEQISDLAVTYAHNPRFHHSKAASVSVGASATPADTENVVLLAVDQPRPSKLIAQLLRSHVDNDALITTPFVPDVGGGHPIIFSGWLIQELIEVSDQQQGIRGILRRHYAVTNSVAVDSPLVRLDINTPADYARAKRDYPNLIRPWQ